MEILEFGNINNPKMLLIHGFQSPYQVWDEYINYYKDEYHVIVPVLPGHNPKLNDRFESMEKIILEIEQFILKYSDSINVVYGMSMGGMIASLLWQNKKIKINKLILDGAPILGMSSLIKPIITKSYINLTSKCKNRDEKVLNQAIGSFIRKENFNDFLSVMDEITNEDIKGYVSAISRYKLPKNISSDTKIIFYHGTKFSDALGKKGAKYIKKYYKNSKIIKMNGLGHCETAFLRPVEMIKLLNEEL